MPFIGEPIESIFDGKLITCTVTGIARKRPQRDVIARANPIQDRVTGYWQCPFCLRADFPDISLVSKEVQAILTFLKN